MWNPFKRKKKDKKPETNEEQSPVMMSDFLVWDLEQFYMSEYTKEAKEKYIPSEHPSVGQTYHIGIARILKNGDIEGFFFDAILLDPIHYMSTVVRGGNYGFIARRTTESYDAMKMSFRHLVTIEDKDVRKKRTN